ncbi:MAG: diacylglycerol kinase [Caldilineaceae bacterium]|nr:diacylglycerol kinase [Caldilineaceae bacterium]MYC62600.1 diacylglycerol kinase family protein [Caldilineaceae bacterium SB0661_bin_34]
MNRFVLGVRHALSGLAHAARRERNFQIELALGLAALAMAWWLRITRIEWLVVVICCGLVLSAELLNTAVEHLADTTGLVRSEQIRVVKDVAAGAVLVAVVVSLAVGAAVFLPYLAAMARS